MILSISQTMSSIFGSVHILVLVTIQLILIRSVLSFNLTNEYLHHKCNNTEGKYRPGSAFEKNLNTIFHDLDGDRKTYFSTGFDWPSEGKEPNMTYIQYQCRGDSYGSTCHSCITTAISRLRRRCSGNKGAIIWYDQCLLIISSVDSYNKIDYENNFYLSNTNKVNGDSKLFNKEVLALLENLRYKAIYVNKDEDKPWLYAVGDKIIKTEKVYAIVQCKKDLVSNSCYACLEYILKKFPECCDGKRGERILGTSCNFRYEFYPFLRS